MSSAAANNTPTDLVMFEVVRILCRAYADAVLNDDLLPSEAWASLISSFDDLYREIGMWQAYALPSSDEISRRLRQIELDIEADTARISTGEFHAETRRIVDGILASNDSETARALQEITNTIPGEFLAFMLNVSNGAFSPEALTSIRREVLAEILKNLRSSGDGSSRDGSSQERAVAIQDALLTYDNDLGTTRATYLHVKCGGERPSTDDDGTLISALQIMAMDFVGARLCGYNLAYALRSHPLISEAAERVKFEDEPILDLFRRPIAQRTASGSIGASIRKYYPTVNAYWSSGGGGTLNITHVPFNILSASVPVGDTTSGILLEACHAVQQAIEIARKLAVGETVKTTAFVGLEKVYFADDVESISVPGARIRRPSPFEKKLSPRASEPLSILEVETSFRLLEVIPHGIESAEDGLAPAGLFTRSPLHAHKDETIRFKNEIDEVISQVRFAIALASPDDGVVGPVWLCTVLRNPLIHIPATWDRQGGWFYTTSAPGKIDQKMAREIEYWGPWVAATGQNLKVGRRRTLQALSERSDPMDSFIDFVIAWENLVGSGENTTYIVAAAMSILLAPDDVEQRKEFFTAIKRLYGFRSKVVHGSAGPGVEVGKFKLADVPKYARDSGRLAIDAFKAVLSRPELVELDSETRARRILVGFA
jgi:hypothetical protein